MGKKTYPKMKVVALILAAVVAVAAGETCEGAQVEAVGFTSRDATIVTKIAFIADFTLSCSNGAKDVSLYAETGDGIVGVARSVDGLKYQVSWVEDVSTATSGEKVVKLYDDQGYAALRKAQRGNEDIAAVSPIATINLYHPGAYKGPWVQSESLALFLGILSYAYAYSVKSKLVA